MRLIDTVVIIGSLDTASDLHRQCMKHLNSIADDRETLVPTATLLEADLVMKGRGFSYDERTISWHALEHRIPSGKVVANSASSILAALPLQEKGIDYFDSLISSLASELGAKVVTTDREIGSAVDTEW
jgi:predicted nucleic acid-binding protein